MEKEHLETTNQLVECATQKGTVLLQTVKTNLALQEGRSPATTFHSYGP